MKRKKVVISLSCALVVTAALAGCGKTETGDSPDASAAPTQTAPRDINILLSHAEGVYAKQSKEDDPYIKELSRLSGYNLKYQFLGHSDYTQQLTLRFASGELGDMVRTPSILSTIHSGAIEQGAFLELSALIDKYGPNLKKKIPETAWKSPKVSKDGKIYGVPTLVAEADRIVFIRQDWLNKLNMQQPKTVDEFLKYFEAVKKEDMNGNGDPNDEYGIGMFDNLEWTDIFSNAFGVKVNMYTWKDGQLVPDIIDPRMKDALTFYKKLYDSGYVNPNLFTRKEAEHNAAIAKGEIGSWGAAVYQYTGYNADGAKNKFLNQPGAAVSMIGAPKGANGQGGIGKSNDGTGFIWVIPKDTKKPEDIIKFMDWAWSDPKADNFFAYGIKDYNYTEKNGVVNFDASTPVNAEKSAYVMFQLSMNIRGNGISAPLVLKVLKDSETMIKGYEMSKANLLKDDALYMPVLKALEGKPELGISFSSGSLFTDMFAKVITGAEPVDTAFDKFVSDWKKRGGDQVIKEATEWYKTFHKK